MESIKELREICQAPRKAFDTWHGKNIARAVSIYITVLFLKLGISANFTTGIFLLSGITASAFLISESRVMVFQGALLFQLWYILDHVDGEIARYKKESSLTGVYFDRISHYIVHPLAFFCLGLGLFFRTGDISNLILGSLAGLSLVLISAVFDIYELLLGNRPKGAAVNLGEEPKSPSLPRRAFSFLHSISTFPVIIDLMLVFAIIDLLLKKDTIVLFLWFYAACATLVWFFRLSYFVLTKKIDKEFQKLGEFKS